MSLLAHAIDPQTQQPRTPMFWVVLGALVVGQLLAFWLLCSHQVRMAQARDNELMVQRMALADCLQYIPASTIATCSQRTDMPARAGVQLAADPSAGAAIPVSFTYR